MDDLHVRPVSDEIAVRIQSGEVDCATLGI